MDEKPMRASEGYLVGIVICSVTLILSLTGLVDSGFLAMLSVVINAVVFTTIDNWFQ